MNVRFLLRGMAPGFSVLALAAMVSTSANAASISLSPNQNGQLGYNGTTAGAFTNTSSGGTLGYNFVYQSVPDSKITSAGGDTGSNLGNQGAVDLDSATLADTACANTCGLLALDADFEQSAVNLSLTGLTANTHYLLTFDFAATQQLYSPGGTLYGSCPNTPGLLCDTNYDAAVNVSANGSSIGTATYGMTNAQSFDPWKGETFSFTTGNSTSETISFLASGVAQNVPAFALVDNVGISVAPPAPEPNSLILLGTGLAGLGGLVRSRFVKAATKA